jgi:hypothetical protein
MHILSLLGTWPSPQLNWEGFKVSVVIYAVQIVKSTKGMIKAFKLIFEF